MNGHSWSSIQKYTLAEIGIFFKTIVLDKRDEKAEQLQNTWMGTHLKKEGLLKVLKEYESKSSKSKAPSIKKVNNDWKRLASFMSRNK